MKYCFSVICLVAILFSSCTYFKNYYRYGEQAAYHFENKEYEMAVSKSIASLERDPAYSKSIDVLSKSYKGMVEQIDIEYNKMPDETTEQKELRAKHLEKVVGLNNRIAALERRGARLALEKISFKEKAREAREIAMESEYKDAEKLGATGSRENQIIAAKMFRELGNFKDASQRYHELKVKAFRSYVFIPTENRTKVAINPDPASVFSEKLVIGMKNDGEFAEFNTINKVVPAIASLSFPNGIQSVQDAINYAKSGDANADFVVYSYLTKVNLLSPKITSEIKDFSKDKEISSTRADGKSVKKVQKVSGKATVYTRELDTHITCQIYIIDMKTGQSVSNKTVTGIHSENEQWGVYHSGDEYALQSARNYVGRTNTPPDMTNRDERLRLATDDLVINSGRVFGNFTITAPDVRPAVDPSGLKIGVDPSKIIDNLK